MTARKRDWATNLDIDLVLLMRIHLVGCMFAQGRLTKRRVTEELFGLVSKFRREKERKREIVRLYSFRW